MSHPLRHLTIRHAAAVVAIAAALPFAHAARAAASTCAVTSLSSSSQSACWQPFTPISPFSTQLTSSFSLASDNTAVQQHMSQYGWWLGDSRSGFGLGLDGTRPVYFATSSDPVLTIDCTSSEGAGTCQGSNGVDVNGMQIHVPAGAQPDSNWDGHMTVVETATGAEYDFWHASISGSTLTAGTGAESNVNTSNGTGGGGDAAGFALTAGLLRPSELLSGQINHALVITVPCTDATGANVGYTYPAEGGWGEFCGEYWSEMASNAPELGQRFALNMTAAQIATSGAPLWEQTVMTALARYGAYIEDTNGSWHSEGMDIATQDPTSWTSLGEQDAWSAVASAYGQSGASTLTSAVPIPVSKLELVNTCVTQGTCLTSTAPVTTPGTMPGTTPVSAPVTTTSTATVSAPTATTSTATPTKAPATTTASTSTTTSTTPVSTTHSTHTRRRRQRSARVLQRKWTATRRAIRRAERQQARAVSRRTGSRRA